MLKGPSFFGTVTMGCRPGERRKGCSADAPAQQLDKRSQNLVSEVERRNCPRRKIRRDDALDDHHPLPCSGRAKLRLPCSMKPSNRFPFRRKRPGISHAKSRQRLTREAHELDYVPCNIPNYYAVDAIMLVAKHDEQN